MSNEAMAQKAADAGAGVAGLFAGATWIVEVEPYLQVGATLVAIVAGMAAAWYHLERAKYMHRKNVIEAKRIAKQALEIATAQHKACPITKDEECPYDPANRSEN